MLQHIQDHWWAYWGIGAGISWMAYQYRQTNTHSSHPRRLKSLIRGYDEHEGGTPPRWLLLGAIALLVLAIATLMDILR